MEQTNRDLSFVKETLKKAEIYQHAANVLNFDMETICPSAAMEKQGETTAFLSTEAYKLVKDEAFIRAAESLYERRFGTAPDETDAENAAPLEELDRLMIESLHRDYEKIKNISAETNYAWEVARNKSYADWLRAKQENDYSIFLPSLAKIREIELESIALRDDAAAPASGNGAEKPAPYEYMLDNYERGITIADLDETFGKCKERLLPFLERIKASKKQIRTDFLTRPVKDEQQKEMARYLLETIGYDFTRGAFTTTEHPFTSDLACDDIRVTTNYKENAFLSSVYSIIHEGGHALFSQMQPRENFTHFIDQDMTMGMHESVSRFYENRIGRSRAFLTLIYPKMKEIFPGLLDDVSAEELYEAANLVHPSLIRTEADEFTYTIHIIIRYELEKEIAAGTIALEDVPKAWDDKYEQYLGVRAPQVSRGVLQDVHWSFGFGYFPTYALGNMYNAMYYNKMKESFDIDAAVRTGDFKTIDGWMASNVFAQANYLPPKEWIRRVTGRAFTPDDFLAYLEEKYGELYALD